MRENKLIYFQNVRFLSNKQAQFLKMPAFFELSNASTSAKPKLRKIYHRTNKLIKILLDKFEVRKINK